MRDQMHEHFAVHTLYFITFLVLHITDEQLWNSSTEKCSLEIKTTNALRPGSQWCWHCERHVMSIVKKICMFKMLFIMYEILKTWLVGCWKCYAHDAGIEISSIPESFCDTCNAMLVSVSYCELGLHVKVAINAAYMYSCTCIFVYSSNRSRLCTQETVIQWARAQSGCVPN